MGAVLGSVFSGERRKRHPFASLDARVADFLATTDLTELEPTLRALLDAGFDHVPLPGHGDTLTRWRTLEHVARHDLALVKCYESHVDALAILWEVAHEKPEVGAVYAVWASEARVDPITIRGAVPRGSNDDVRIDGRKAWCSGAGLVDVALMTAVDAAGGRRLVEVRLDAPGLTIDASRWHAVGMRDSGSFDVVCIDVPARLVGDVGAYLDRPGFWQGGAGVAACWYGAAAAIGTRMRDLQIGRDDVHALAHLGAIDERLAAAGALLRECAAAIDDAPSASAMRPALRVRGAVAATAESVIEHASHALGPGPLCNDPRLARHVADLPVFIRQSRAEHDRVALGRALLADDDAMSRSGWTL